MPFGIPLSLYMNRSMLLLAADDAVCNWGSDEQ